MNYNSFLQPLQITKQYGNFQNQQKYQIKTKGKKRYCSHESHSDFEKFEFHRNGVGLPSAN